MLTVEHLHKEEKKLIGKLLPANCHWFVAKEAPKDFKLYPQEHQLTSKMATKRLNEFRASRHCAKEALNQLGITQFPLLTNEHRAPNWPDRIVGSISHTNGRCIAVACQVKNLRSIGIDVELSEPLKSELLSQIITPIEQKQLFETNSPHVYAKLIFSIKESIFKCLHPIYLTWIGFKDLSVKLDFENASFSISQEEHFNSSLPLSELKGSWHISNAWIYTCCWLEPALD